MTNLEIFLPRDELPEPADGEYYCFELEGLDVETPAGESLGTLEKVLQTGSNDVYVVKQGEHEHLIPVLADVVKEIDLDKGKIVLEPPEVVDAI